MRANFEAPVHPFKIVTYTTKQHNLYDPQMSNNDTCLKKSIVYHNNNGINYDLGMNRKLQLHMNQ